MFEQLKAKWKALTTIPKRRELIYRKITQRVPAVDEPGVEIAQFECGHVIKIIHHRREVLPCDACRDEAKS